MRQRAGTAEERLARLLEIQQLLARVARDIGPALELQVVLSTALSAMRSLVEFRGGSVGLVDELGHVRIAAADPPVSDDVAAASVRVGTGLAGRVVSTGQPVYSSDLDRDPRVDPALRALGSNAPMRSYLGVPLVCLGQVIGLLQVDSADVDAFDADDLHVLEGLAVQVAGAIESARRYEQAVELERLKTDFIARVSHELRTPITIISGFLATLAAHGGRLDAREQTAMIDRIRTANSRLHSLVDELLTVTSFEAGVAQLEPVDVPVAVVLDDVRALCTNPDKVQVACDPDLHVLADPRLLQHALALLVDNALKYAGDATLSAGTADGHTWIEVRDHGPGIPAELGERVFERFTRGSHTMPGMGLGLPLVRTLAGGLGARVDLRRPEGGGAAFRLTFG